MAKLLVPLFMLFLMAVTGSEPDTKLNGAFIRTSYKFGEMKDWANDDSLTVVKVFRDGYWFVAFYNDRRKGRQFLDGIGGGTYKLVNGKYVEHISFYSWDSTAVGQEIEFGYNVDDQHYEQYGVLNSEKYPNFPINEKFERMQPNSPLADVRLEGVWKLKNGNWGGEERFGGGMYKNATALKIYSSPMAVYAFYDDSNKKFLGGGGVRYGLSGNTLTETNEFWSWQPDGSRNGLKHDYLISVDQNKLTQKGRTGSLTEEYEKLR